MNRLTLQMPYQLFIGGEFVDAEGAKTYNTINPTDGSVSRLQPPFLSSHLQPVFSSSGQGPVPRCIYLSLLQTRKGSILGHRRGVEQVNEEKGERRAGRH